MKSWITLLVAIVIVIATIPIPGCQQHEWEALQAAQADAQQKLEIAEQTIAALETQIAEDDSLDEETQLSMQEDLRIWREKLADATQMFDEISTSLLSMKSPEEAAGSAIEMGTSIVSPMLPPPWNFILYGVGAAVAGALGGRKLERETVTKPIVRGIAAGGGPMENASVVETAMGTTARDVVRKLKAKL